MDQPDPSPFAEPAPTQRTLASLWHESAARFAERLAIADGQVSLSYGALDARVRELTARLADGGVEPGDLCGLYLERSIDAVVAMLAVAARGAAWLPLDPSYPLGRLRLMAQDAQIRHLVSDRDATGLRLGEQVGVYHPQPPEPDAIGLPGACLAAQGSDIAYVIYTSGSTGRPKGVQIEHRSLIAFISSMQALLGVGPKCRFLSVSSPSFDIALLDIFLPLSCGGSVMLTAPQESRDGRLLKARVERERPSHFQATPATWRMLLAAGWQGDANLTLLTGAEAIAPAMARDLMQRSRAVWNLYGPTETTVWTTAACLTETDLAAGRIPIGRPLPHAEVEITDASGQPIPSGEIGEVCILGAGLGRGYIGDRALTAEKFVALPSGRAYRTGDRGRLEPDGQLSFHGRIDHQIKLNSFRIEPAEVETVLRSHPAVRDAVVAAKTIGDGEPKLVAYVVPSEFDANWSRRTRLAAHWRAIWTQAYEERRVRSNDPTFNTAGLISSFSGVPIPEAELREWRDEAVARIASLNPERILDLGCGSGLMLFPLAPLCRRYVGVDFSPVAIADLRREARARNLGHVELLEQSVDEADGIEDAGFDLVVLNTVIQYFPDVAFVERVLDNALRALRPGGAVFIGDVRDFTALEALHAAIAEYKAEPGDDPEAGCARLQRIAEREAELTFDHRWFDAYAEARPEITAVQVRHKDGAADNELTAFRYDVLLRKDGPVVDVVPTLIHDGAEPDTELSQLWAALRDGAPGSALVLNLVNARRAEAFAALERIRGDQGDADGVPNLAFGERADPHEIVCAARLLGYRAQLLPDPGGSPAHFAALLVREAPDVGPWSHRLAETAPRERPAVLSNELQQIVATPAATDSVLTEELQRLATEQLPAPFCPSLYLFLKELPLTPSRKIDRQALPDPAATRPDLRTPFVAPRDTLEIQLSKLFADALSVGPVGATDSFFDLGGDSLATVELLLLVEEKLGTRIELARFLERPTVEALARRVHEAKDYRPASASICLKAEGAKEPLFFIHGAGGLAFTVFEVGQALRGDRPVFVLQDPACDPAIEPARRIEDMAAALVDAVREVQPDGPYHLCGHSFGGLLAYEMAIQLRRAGQPVSFLGLLDTPTPPGAACDAGLVSRARLWWRELRFLCQILTQAGPMAADGCYVLFGAEARYRERRNSRDTLDGWLKGLWADALFRYFHRRAGLASAVSRDSRLLMLRQPGIRRAIRLTGIHDAARRRYRPSPYDGPVTLFRAEQASAETSGFSNDTLGWDRLAADVETVWSPGSHFTMTRGENAKCLAAAVDAALAGRPSHSPAVIASRRQPARQSSATDEPAGGWIASLRSQ